MTLPVLAHVMLNTSILCLQEASLEKVWFGYPASGDSSALPADIVARLVVMFIGEGTGCGEHQRYRLLAACESAACREYYADPSLYFLPNLSPT